MRRAMHRAVVFCVIGLLVTSTHAADNDRLAQLEQENAALKSRLTALEAALADVQKALGKSAAAATEAAAQKAVPTAPSQTAPAKPAKPAVTTKWGADFYGYLKFDASYDSADGQLGNLYFYVNPRHGTHSDSTMSVTARQSRLDFGFTGPGIGHDGRSSGKLEVDFYGDSPENKNAFMMRHAYGLLEWPKSDFSILFGQTWDVVSPLTAPTINFAVGWDAGNVGFRRPQLRFTKGWSMGPGVRGEAQLAVARSIGRTTSTSPPADTGGDSAMPNMQSRLGLTFPGISGRPTTLGLSGMWGQEEIRPGAGRRDKYLDSWLWNLDYTVPFTKWLTLQGEIWQGANIGTFYGGIGQGVNMESLTVIRASGGWFDWTIGPFKRAKFHVGAGLDDPRDKDLAVGGRTRNYVLWGNHTYDLSGNTTAGIECSYWSTRYSNSGSCPNLRVQMMMQYGF